MNKMQILYHTFIHTHYGGKLMLLRYIVSNYKSIGHHIEFSMFPTEPSSDDSFLTTIETKMGKWQILRRGALFGPNASGKSSFIESIRFAKHYITNGQKNGKSTFIPQFKGDFEDLNGVSTFQFMFYLDGEIYDYGFSLDQRQVHEEWLMVLTEENFVPIFTRTTNQNEKTDIEMEASLISEQENERTLAEILQNSIQKNQLFLYKLYDNGIKKIETIMEWFEKIQIIFPNTKLQGLPLKIKEDEQFREFLSQSLNSLDTGVFQITASTDEIDFKELVEKMDLPQELIAEIEEMKNGIVNLNGKYFIFAENKNHTTFIQVKFEHHLNNKVIRFNIDDESDGTQRLLDLLPILFQLQKKSNTIYFVDELDRSLHSKLSKYFLKTFIENSQDTCKQLVFTAHDTNLIDLTELTQEEIWFVEKNQLGETTLKPFSDFTIHAEHNTIKDYLNGRFGAVPVIQIHSVQKGDSL